jgi:syntaxin 5
LFDDRPVEIQELTHVIKQDITRINSHIKNLEHHLQQQTASVSNRQTKEYASSVIVSLQSKLASASSVFKDVLELRSQNMREQKERRDQFAYGSASSSAAPAADSPLYALERRSAPVMSSESSSNFISIEMPMQQQQLQMMSQQNSYLESRTEAIEGIEKTIGDLASLFQQLTTMISAHDDLVRRCVQVIL